jgi:hypothetical protein
MLCAIAEGMLMAAWLTVYCCRSVNHIKADELLTLLRNLEDPYTLAEGFGIEDEEVVDRALAHLRLESVSEPEGVKFALRYKARNTRPVYFHHWRAKKRVRVERAEALERLEGATGRNVTRVRNHIAKCVDVVALELGWNQLEDMGMVLAGQIAEFLAIEGNGLILDQNDDWWAMKRNGAPVLLVRGRDES